MKQTIPSAEKIAEFVSDGSAKSIEALITNIEDSMRDEIDESASEWPKELAIKFLHRVLDERFKRFEERFSNDEVFKWLESDKAIQSGLHKAFGISKHSPSSNTTRDELLCIVQNIVDERYRTWGARVIEDGRYSARDNPMKVAWIMSSARQMGTQWKWYLGVAEALSSYLYTDTAAELLSERRIIRSIHAEAVNGLIALERLTNTRFAKHFGDPFRFIRSYESEIHAVRRAALESLASLKMEDFYPTVRNDSTVQERLLVSALSDLHCELFGTPKPHAIYELMGAEFIRNPIEPRNIQRICSNRRRSITDLSKEIGNIKEQLRERRRLNTIK